MNVFSQKEALGKVLLPLRHKGQKVGLVPTMGALHEGHLSLARKALKENDLLVVSIFVNPTQFNNPEDLAKYPRTLEKDIALLSTVSDDILVYAPSVEDIYEENTNAENFDFDGLEHEMEGRFRPGHFDGVGTIVKRLFEIVEPDNAYFGEKDFQQLAIIKKMVSKNNLPVNVVGCPILREKDGLAMSSRNVRLKPNYRKVSPFIYKTLRTAKEKFGTKSANYVTQWVKEQFAKEPLLKLEYFIVANSRDLKPVARKSKKNKYRAFIAVYADDVRLIDNIALN